MLLRKSSEKNKVNYYHAEVISCFHSIPLYCCLLIVKIIKRHFLICMYSFFLISKGLKEVMGIEGVDGHKTVTNHIIELMHILGIEAARYGIIDQIQYTMKQHGMSIDVRHIMLLADMMTVRVSNLKITIRPKSLNYKSHVCL
jgi:hypothetical protein